MDGWKELSVEQPESMEVVELMSIATHKGTYDAEKKQWLIDPDEEVVGNITHWRPLSTKEEEISTS